MKIEFRYVLAFFLFLILVIGGLLAANYNVCKFLGTSYMDILGM